MSRGIRTLEQVVRRYEKDFPKYQDFSAYVAGLIEQFAQGYVHTVQHRAKSPESFEKKCLKTNDDGSLRYPAAPTGITDLAGVRVIVFTRDSVERACDEINAIFNVFEVEDVGERVYQKGRFGYQSKHLLLKLGDDRINLRENSSYSGFICEVQVRTILQHAWAELEHDIQYKSARDIPLDLNKRFSALAGLLEIADREFQQIQNESAALKATVKADLISELTREGLSEKGGAGTQAGERAENVRDLISNGRYGDAVDSFSQKIASTPNNYTLYIGRAKALYLAGDSRGAVADLDAADQLSGSSIYTERLRSLIERGDSGAIVASYSATPEHIRELHNKSANSLESGDGITAFQCYEELSALGQNTAIMLFGKATCCALEKDIQGARNFMSSLKPRMGTPMAVNILTLRAVVNILDGSPQDEDRKNVQSALEQAPQFRLDATPLKWLFIGFIKKNYDEQPSIREYEELLSKHPLSLFGLS